MANRYWVGGTDNWDATAGSKWSTTSGGAGGSAVPTAADDVFIDSNAGGNITLTATANCRSINFVDGTGGAFTGTFTHNNFIINVGDATAGAGNVALKMSSSMTYAYTNYISSGFTFKSTSATQQTITTNGKSVAQFIVDGVGSSYIFGSNHTGTYVTLYKGTLDTGNYDLNIQVLSSGVTTTRTLTLGSSTITISGSIAIANVTGLTLNAGTSVIIMNSSGQTIDLGGGTLNEVRYTGTNNLDIQSTGSPTITTLKIQPTDSSNRHSLVLRNNLTVGTLVTTSQGRGKRIQIVSNSIGTARTLTVGTLSLEDTDFRDITAAGAASWNISSITGGAGDLQGNTGITFTTGATQYWVGNGGYTSDVNHWANTSGGTGGTGRVPLAQDTLRWDSSSISSSSQTIYFDISRFGTVDFTGVTNSPTLAAMDGGGHDTSKVCYGSFTLDSTLTRLYSWSVYFSDRSATTKTIDMAGVSGFSILISGINASSTYQLASSLVGSGMFSQSSGSFDTANYDMDLVNTFSIGGTGSFTAGSSDISLSSTYPTFSNSITTFSAGTSTFSFTPNATGTITLPFGGKTYYNVDVVTANRTYDLNISGNNTFSNRLNIYDTGNPTYNLKFTAGSTQTLGTSFDIHGSSGYPINIMSSSSGSTFTFSKPSGTATVSYVTLKDNVASGGATFKAVNSSIVSNVTGWTLWNDGDVYIPSSYEIATKVEELKDSFDGITLDTVKWDNWGGAQVTLDDRLKIQTTAVSDYYGINSHDLYSLEDSHIQVSLYNDPPETYASTETEMALSLNGSNNLLFSKYKDGSTWKLLARKKVAGSGTNLATITWNYSTMKWWRIRESGGTVYWDYSADGATWTNLTSTAKQFNLSSLYVDLLAGQWQTEAGGVLVEFDDFNYDGIVAADITKTAAYTVLYYPTITKTAAYAVTGLLSVTKTASYLVASTPPVIQIASSYEVIGTPLQKTFSAKIYDPSGTYITTWDKEVVSDFTISEELNSGGSTVNIELARVADDFGEGADVNYRNKVEIYAIDKEEPNGLLVFTGYINSFKADYKDDTVSVTIYSYGAELSSTVMEDGSGNTTIAYNSYDPSDIIKEILDDYAGEITYDGSSIDDTSTTVSYTFNTNTVKEGLDKALELAPEGWYYYIDQATNLLHFHELATTPDHTFAIGRDIKDLSIEKNMSKVINTVYFSGGGSPVLYKKYTIPASITTYGIRGYRYKDGRVTLTATADIIATRILQGSPEILVTLTVVDSNLNQLGYDIESIKLGETVKIGSSGIGPSSAYDTATYDTSPFDYDLSNLSSIVFQVTSRQYTGDALSLSLSTTPPDITKRIQDIYRNLKGIENENNPTAPS